MSQVSGQNRPRSQQYRVYDESLISQDPIPFVTARRFWVLVYMLLGSTGVAMLLARFAIRPLVDKVTKGRQALQSHVVEQMRLFVDNVAKSITALPGRQIIVDTNRHRLYVNTETQTDLDNTPTTAEEAVEMPSETKNFEDIRSKLKDFGQAKEEELYTDLSSKIADLKTYLYEFESYSFKSSYGGFGTGSSTSTGYGGEAIQKVKAEIRSVKGSLLNARTFSSAQSKGNLSR